VNIPEDFACGYGSHGMILRNADTGESIPEGGDLQVGSNGPVGENRGKYLYLRANEYPTDFGTAVDLQL
jgi:hypothetical protein